MKLLNTVIKVSKVSKVSKAQGLIHIDPRTKLLIILIVNVTVFFANSLSYEVLIASVILVFGVLCGAYRLSIKMAIMYMGLIVVQYLSHNYLSGSLDIMIGSFCMFIRKIFPCGMIGGILIKTTRVNEFMVAMNRINMPKNIVIPLTVMLRYFPTVGEWRYIKDAMKMRDVSPSFSGMIISPVQTVECVYVPLMMSASKIADELSASAITRGIENPQNRTCIQKIKFTYMDFVCTIGFLALLIITIIK